MSVRADVAALQPQALVEVFEFNPTNIGETADKILRWHPGTQVDQDPIVWQGVTYQPFPVQHEGFESSVAGKLPRPTLRAANIGGSLGAFLRTMEGGLGAKVIRRRTLAKYLDAVNFPAGNPHQDYGAHFPDEIFYLAKVSVENPIFMQLELAVPFDVAGVQLPRRQVLAGTCQWIYRSAECTYAGPPVTTDPIFGPVDKCSKSLTACKKRFGTNGVLPISTFPSSLIARYV